MISLKVSVGNISKDIGKLIFETNTAAIVAPVVVCFVVIVAVIVIVLLLKKRRTIQLKKLKDPETSKEPPRYRFSKSGEGTEAILCY